MADKVQLRRDTAARWAQFNPVLSEGEVGYVTDNPNQYKIGDGIHAWNELPLRGFDGTLVQETGDDENVVMSQKSVTKELSELKIKPYIVFNSDFQSDLIKASKLLKEIYVDTKLDKPLYFYGVRKSATTDKLQIAFILEEEAVYWVVWEIETSNIGECIFLSKKVKGVNIYAVIDLSQDFVWSNNRIKLNDNIYKTEYSSYIFSQIKTDELENRINAISGEMQDKNLVIMGDSIMMLMRTNSVPSNTITYQDDEGITYDYSLLTNKNGHLYVTSTLQDDNVIETSKMVEIVNSSQAAFDAQNWDALKQKLGVRNLYNFGLGGATFAERQVVTSYPYPDGNGWTTDLPNEVRWLIRRYTEENVEYPDCIVIWLGTNGAGEPSSDNYNEIMALTYDELNSDEHYADRKTLYGGLRWSLETLYRTFQYATIILVTPVQTNPENYRTYDKLTTTANAIKKMAGRYSCMVFDALNEIGVVDFFEKSDSSGYFLYDGVHPNSKGKILWKNYLAQKLKSLFFCKK